MTVEISALGTHWWLSLPENISKEVVNKLLDIVKEFEDDYSRFDDNSLIGKLNDSKFLDNPPDELINMLKYAHDVYTATNGVFNISVGSELEKKGYGIKIDQKSKVSLDLKSDLRISKKSIKLSNSTRIDLGGFGKGWLIEKLAGYLKLSGVQDFVINGGGDLTVSGKSITAYIEHPMDSKLHIGSIELQDCSLASSSNLKRNWAVNGKRHAHIFNPLKNTIADILSIHVLSKSILFADTFATVFMLVERENRLKFALEYGLEFMEILPDLTTFKTKGFDIKLN